MNIPIENNLRANGNTPAAQFKKQITPIANISTSTVSITLAYQAEFALMLGYTQASNSWIVGYNFWTRSNETIALCVAPPITDGTWAIKGDATVFGYEGTTPVALSATQSQATIYGGTNFGNRGAASAPVIALAKQNPAIDNPAIASADFANTNAQTALSNTSGGNPATAPINTSREPVILKISDLDFDTAATHAQSHSIFAHIQHTWKNQKSWTHYISFGGQIEFSPTCDERHSRNKKSPLNCALAHWGIWLSSGFNY